jgi:hypothetical protein
MNENLDINAMLKHIADKQQKDAKISKILLQVKSGAHTEKMACNGAEAKFRIEENGALMERVFIRTSRITAPKECWAILVPKCLKKAVLHMFHSNDSLLGHLGRYKTHCAMRERFVWRGMVRDLRKWIRSCHHCLSRKGTPPLYKRYNLYEETQAPMNRIAIDIVGPLTTSKRGNTYILTMFCPFSHWPEAYPLSSTKAKEVIECLKKHIANHSIPAEVLSDRGKNFMSKEVKQFLTKMGSRKTQTSPYKPSSNGSVEGFHSYLAKAISACVNDQHDDWDEHLHSVLFAYRATPMDGLGMSPFEVIYGRKPNLPIDLLIGREISTPPITTPEKHREMVMKGAEKLFPAIRDARQQRFNRNQRQDGEIQNHEYSLGDKVYLHFQKVAFAQ